MRTLLAAACLSAPHGSAEEIYGMVIGIDHYPRLENGDLYGAVNDANALGDALEAMGARKVVRLLDGNATRTAIIEGFRGLADESPEGSLLVLTFAGHGSQMWTDDPAESDQLDEFIALSGYAVEDSSDALRQQSILDDEWRALITMVKDRRVLVVFDACHSGTMTRTANARPDAAGRVHLGPRRRAAMPTTRATGTGSFAPSLDRHLGERAVPDLRGHETYIGAGDDTFEVPEVFDERNEAHGALSLYMARALRGEADSNGDKQTTRRELRQFLVDRVRLATDSEQTPRIEFSGSDTVSAFGPPGTSSSTDASVPTATPPLLLRTEGERARDAAGLAGVQRVVGEHFELHWRSDGTVERSTGEIVGRAHDVASMQQVVDKWRTVRALSQLSTASVIDIRISRAPDGPNDAGWYAVGEHAYFSAPAPSAGRSRRAINMASGGELQDLRSGEPGFLRVVAPTGADHLVLVEWQEDASDGFRQWLEAHHGKPVPDANSLLDRLRDLKGLAIGMRGFYSCDTDDGDVPCPESR